MIILSIINNISTRADHFHPHINFLFHETMVISKIALDDKVLWKITNMFLFPEQNLYSIKNLQRN